MAEDGGFLPMEKHGISVWLHQLREDVNYFTKGFWAMDNGEWRM